MNPAIQQSLCKLALIVPLVAGLSISGLSQPVKCEKPGWDTQGWPPVTHYYAVGAVTHAGRYMRGDGGMAALFQLADFPTMQIPPFGCGLAANAVGKAYVIRLGGVYEGLLTKEITKQSGADSRVIKFNDRGDGLEEDDVVYFPAKTVTKTSGSGGKVIILGAIKKPGEYEFQGSLQLAEAIRLAGGLNFNAAERGVRLRGAEIVNLSPADFSQSQPLAEIRDGDVIVISDCRRGASFGRFDARPLCD